MKNPASNSRMTVLRSMLAAWLVASMALLGVMQSAQAAIVGTQQHLGNAVPALSSADREAQIEQARAFLAREDVRRQLQSMGVAPEQASERVASLTDAELQQLSQTIGSEPAAGDAGLFVVLGVVFLVLLVLDLTGVVHIFRH